MTCCICTHSIVVALGVVTKLNAIQCDWCHCQASAKQPNSMEHGCLQSVLPFRSRLVQSKLLQTLHACRTMGCKGCHKNTTNPALATACTQHACCRRCCCCSYPNRKLQQVHTTQHQADACTRGWQANSQLAAHPLVTPPSNPGHCLVHMLLLLNAQTLTGAVQPAPFQARTDAFRHTGVCKGTHKTHATIQLQFVCRDVPGNGGHKTQAAATLRPARDSQALQHCCEAG
jgi:hypothetical protein